MRALVVFESMFGNTREIATAVADGLSTHLPVDITDVGHAPMVLGPDVALLVVGGPTHAHGLSNPETRRSASERPGADQDATHMIGIREWLTSLGNGPSRVAAAAFDTRISGPRLLWGSAARAAEAQLRKAGAHVVIPAESFLVGGPLGPTYPAIRDGEIERARQWGERLGSRIAD